MSVLAQQNTLGEKYSQLISVLCEISETNYFLGRLDEALALLQLNHPLADNADVPVRARSKLLIQHSKLLINRGGLNNTFATDGETIQRMLATVRQAALDEDLLAEALHLTGLLYYWPLFEADTPDAEPALSYFTQAYEHRVKLDDKRGVSESLFYLGLIYQIFEQDNEKAEGYFAQALQLAETYQFKLEKSYVVRHLGFIYEARKEFAQARQYLEQSLALREEIGFKIYFPFSHLALGDLAMSQNDLATAEQHYQKALELAEEMGLRVQIVHGLLALAQLCEKQGEATPARLYCEKAQALSNEIQFKYGIAESANILTNLSVAS
jgi:tetratricopeptide (TPR) repeat protein